MSQPTGKPAEHFGQGYYDKWYRTGSNVASLEEDRQWHHRRAEFALAYARWLRMPVRGLLEIGCGLGWWKDIFHRDYPHEEYLGVEYSPYLCKQYGWTKGDVRTFTWSHPFDIVVCEGVFQYLGDDELAPAFANLEQLVANLLVFDVVTLRDYYEVYDPTQTDADCHLRSWDVYAELLHPHYIFLGGGLFLHRKRTRDYLVPDMMRGW